MSAPRVLRIGEVARRTGVPVSTLRAWERRYGLLDPERTEGGHRLYGQQDLERVRRMQVLLDRGWSASVAAAEIASGNVTTLRPTEPDADAGHDGSPSGDLAARLEKAFHGFDADAADAVIDDTFARLDVGAALDDVILPVVRKLAIGWEEDPGVIAREHFATHTVRPRLIRLLRSGMAVDGRVLVAASPEREEHDLGVLAGAVVAAAAGWRVHFLGSRSPAEAISRTLATVESSVALIGALQRSTATDFLRAVRADNDVVWVLGGPGFRSQDVEALPLAIHHEGSYRDIRATLDATLRLLHDSGDTAVSDG